MKKILLFSMLITIVSLTSYSQQKNLTLGSGEMVSINFTINDAIQTRSGSATRYIIEVYEGTDVSSTPVHLEKTANDFTVSIKQNTDYVCLFWADDGAVDKNTTGTYNASSLKNVTLNAGKEMTEAFFVQKAVNIRSSTGVTDNVTLKRAVAEVNFIETDAVAANTNLQVDFNSYRMFNVFTGGVVGSTAATSKTFNSSATMGSLGTLLTFASVAGITADFTALYNSTVTNNMTSVSLKANYRTYLRGKFATQP